MTGPTCKPCAVELDFSRPGKPTDNAFIEAFNGGFRQERRDPHNSALILCKRRR